MAHRVKRVRRLALVLAWVMLLGGAAALSAQGPDRPSGLHLFAERYSLTLYVGGREPASLAGLQWAVIDAYGQTKILTLADAFGVLVLTHDLAQPGGGFVGRGGGPERERVGVGEQPVPALSLRRDGRARERG